MKKIINIFLILSVFLTQSANADILDEALNNVANVSTFVEADGTTNIYTGSASIRFNNVVPPGPLWSFTPPSIQAGCNGIDIKGMFMSLLGIDQLGEMIQNAGATLAWGVAVGIIYSLPGIASAFQWINNWAKKIQELLAAACGNGIKIGQWLAKEAGIDKLELGEKINSFVTKLDPRNFLALKQKGEAALLDVLGLGDIIDGNIPEGTKEEKQEIIADLFRSAIQSDASVLGAIISEITQNTQGLGTSFESKFNITPNNVGVSAISETDLDLTASNLDEMGGLIDNGSLTGASQARLSLFAYVLIYNFIGDLGLNIDGKNYTELFKIGNFANDVEKEKAKAQFETVQKSKLSTVELIAGMGPNVPIKNKAKLLSEFIWYGVSDDNSDGIRTTQAIDNATKNKTIKAPKLTIVTIRDDKSSTVSSFIPIIDAKKQKGGDVKDYYSDGTSNYKGAIATSKCIIDKLVEGGEDADTSSCGGSLIFPELHKYVKIIKNSPNFEQHHLKYKLTKVMGAKMAIAILEAMNTSLSHVKGSSSKLISNEDSADLTKKGNKESPSTASNDNEVAKAKLRQEINDTIYYAYEYIEEYLAEEFAQIGVIESIFEEQDKRNRERGLKSLQK